MEQKTKIQNETMKTILPWIIYSVGKEYSAYGIVDFADAIVRELAEKGYMLEEKIPLLNPTEPYPSLWDYITAPTPINCELAE